MRKQDILIWMALRLKPVKRGRNATSPKYILLNEIVSKYKTNKKNLNDKFNVFI